MTTLNDYIIQNAEHGDGDEFLRKFGATEVFFSIQSPDESLKDGPLLTSPDVDLKIQTAQLEIGRVAVFYTTKSDARLFQRFGGLPLIKAAEMVSNLQEIDGMLIQSDRDAWFIADKLALKHVVGRVRSSDLSIKG
ncbi:MAG: hypothetical protein IPN64_04480 [Propionivibrio sp.]|uniref:hypothetical protein n=1 Tax=Propionivibrio sp. TaxID=2212460 RepID=UPI0025F464A5|nr:hypothetical protein [Propionivibrio sp.]MBK8893322.1 hypothetical protein [Propionivibrio sp.]